MQLILEPESIGNIKMATQTESAVNRDIGDFKKEINRSNKENSPNIGDGLTTKPDKSKIVKATLEVDRPQSESINQTVNKEEKFQTNNKNCDENIKTCNLEVIETLNNGDLVENSSHIVNDNTTNGKIGDEDENKSEFTNITLEKTDASEEINLVNSNNDEVSVTLTGKEVIGDKLDLLDADKTKNGKFDDISSAETPSISTSDTDVEVQEIEHLSEVTAQVCNVLHSQDVLSKELKRSEPDTYSEKLECTSTISDDGTDGVHHLSEETSETSSIDKKNLVNINIENTNSMDQDEDSEVSSSVMVNNEPNCLTEEMVFENNRIDGRVNDKQISDKNDEVGIVCNEAATKELEPCVKDDEKPQLPENATSDVSNHKILPEAETRDISMHIPTKTDIIDEKEVLKNCTSVVQENGAIVMSSPEMCGEKKLVNDKTEIKNVPMETDDVEIVDLDKDKTDFNKTSSNEDFGTKSNELEIVKSDLISEKNIDKCTTQITLNECVEMKEDTEASTSNESDIQLQESNKEKNALKKDQEKVEILDEDDIKIVENKVQTLTSKTDEKQKIPERKETKTLPVVCKLSNTLNILSDDEDEEESLKIEKKEIEKGANEKQCIDIDDDDDIMLIEEDSNSKEASPEEKIERSNDKQDNQPSLNNKVDDETREKEANITDISDLSPKINEKDSSPLENMEIEPLTTQADKILEEEIENKPEKKKPLLPQNFLNTAKKNLADMTRDELEDFCILRIVESIVDRSNLSDIKTKMKTMAQTLEDFRKRAQMLTKQNRDLQVVVKSVQEEQKKRSNTLITPLKITRSVGMQVLMNDNKVDSRKKGPIASQPAVTPVMTNRPVRGAQNAKNLKAPGAPASIPVPRKVPVNNSPAKALTNPANNVGKSSSPNGVWNLTPAPKVPEKRPHSRTQSNSAVTVDLTDDEPPAKINNKNSPVPPVRVIPQQNLLAQQRPFVPLNSPRKVYIPISGPQGQNIRPGQTLMMKSVPSPGPRQRLTSMPRMPLIPARVNKQVAQRHPAPLPEAMKQYTPPTWKGLPPAPDLKLSKVENGIVISWKIDGYPEGGYETIASYQLYAYQETSAPPCTSLWKKIGDVKALPLPMACTLTQFMAGFKYYFAVRAVDVRSRLGPFSLPGSILLLNKM